MKYGEIKNMIYNLLDGRDSFENPDLIPTWLTSIRNEIVVDPFIVGNDGLWCAYVEATIEGGSIAYSPENPESRFYLLPDDFIGHELVFYDGKPLVNALSLKRKEELYSAQRIPDSGGTPEMYLIRGLELELIPPANEFGKEIALYYYAQLPPITSITPDDFEDEFMRVFPQIHYYGGALKGAMWLGNERLVAIYRENYQAALQALKIYNKWRTLKKGSIRFYSLDQVPPDKWKYLRKSYLEEFL